jgi:hypothetical protein
MRGATRSQRLVADDRFPMPFLFPNRREGSGQARISSRPSANRATSHLYCPVLKRIVYLSWPAGEISGGIKMAFRHVEALRENGFDAVVATADGARPTWFETSAPVIALTDLHPADDILVFPENHFEFLNAYAIWSNKKIVFCQSQLMICRGVRDRGGYEAFGVSEIISCGTAATEFCHRRFPNLPVHTIPNYIDSSKFTCPTEKKLQIAFLPKKRRQEAAVLLDLFRAENPDLAGIPWVEIDGLTEDETARVLRESAVYLSLCRFEACPLMPLEAMSCGCVVAGFTGGGGQEYATLANGFWAAEDDCLACATQLAAAVRLAKQGGPRYRERIQSARLTASFYCRERTLDALLRYWRRVLPKSTPSAAG